MTARGKLRPARAPMRVAEIPLGPQLPALVLFGRDTAGRPRAAWFASADVQGATEAAGVMRLRTLPLRDDPARQLAAQLIRGRLLPSGRALVPFAKRDLYARLVALAGEEAGLGIVNAGRTPHSGPADATGSGPTNGASAQPGEQAPEPLLDGPAGNGPLGANDAAGPAETAGHPPAPRPGDRAFVGHPQPGDRTDIGLGSMVLAHEGPDDGWWEAEVIGINGRVFSLRWCHFPTEPTILRKAGELALLPPGES